MKKSRIWIAMILVLMLALLAGCKSRSAEGPTYDGSERAGYYKLTTLDNGEEVTDAALFEAMDLQAYLVLNEDLTGHLDLFGTDIDFTWDGDKFSLDDESMAYTYSDKQITIDSDGSVLTFAYAGTPAEAPAQDAAATPASSETEE